MKEKIVSTLTLFGSAGTLICCVLPIVVSLIAGGAAVSAMVSAFPWLIPISQNTGWVFGVAGTLITFNTFLLFRKQKNGNCQIKGGSSCKTRSQWSKVILCFSIGIYLIGVFFAYLLVPIINILGA